MSRQSRRDVASSPFAWTTIFYLLLVFIAPLALLGTAHASEEQTPLQENYGT
ncbi:ATPase with role in protein import into the ER, partial [Ophidiomyces ophidiicola]